MASPWNIPTMFTIFLIAGTVLFATVYGDTMSRPTQLENYTGCTEDELEKANQNYEQCFLKYGMNGVEIQALLEAQLQKQTECDGVKGIDECWGDVLALSCLKPKVRKHLQELEQMEKAMLKYSCDHYDEIKTIGVDRKQCKSEPSVYIESVTDCMSSILQIANSFELEFDDYQCGLLSDAFECVKLAYSEDCTKAARTVISDFLEFVMNSTSCDNNLFEDTGCHRSELQAVSAKFGECSSHLPDMKYIFDLKQKHVCDFADQIANCWNEQITNLTCLNKETKKAYKAMEMMMVVPFKYYCDNYDKVQDTYNNHNCSEGDSDKSKSVNECLGSVLESLETMDIKFDNPTCHNFRDSLICTRRQFRKCSKGSIEMIRDVTRAVFQSTPCYSKANYINASSIFIIVLAFILVWPYNYLK